MKKGDILEGVIERVDFPNKGRVKIDGETVTVKNGIPGQRVRFAVNKKRKNKAEGRLLEVLEPSPLEKREPVCSIFPACGGCMYQTMSYEDQLAMKEAQVKKLLDEAILGAGQVKENGEPDYIFDGIKGSPKEFAYRNKMEFSFGDEYKDGPLALGLHKKGSTYDILTASDCKIVHSDMTVILNCVLEWARELEKSEWEEQKEQGNQESQEDQKDHEGQKGRESQIDQEGQKGREDQKDQEGQKGWEGQKGQEGQIDQKSGQPDMLEADGSDTDVEGEKKRPSRLYYHKMSHVGWLRHLLLRRGETTGEILVNLVTTSQREYDLSPLVGRLLALPLEGKIVGILHIINDSLADVVRSDETRILYGQDYFYETILGLRFKITPFSFFQTNSLGAEVLYQTARDYIGDTKDMTIFDLYSGTGTIAQILAPVAREVIGVEIVEEAVEAARENAAMNGLTNCRFIADDVLKALDQIPEKPDFIVLDPPRDGIHPKALSKIINYGVDRMVYISCKPTSLARDLEVLIGNGYRVERVCMVDLFCATVHVETVCLLSNRKCGGKESKSELAPDLGECRDTALNLKSVGRKPDSYVRLSLDMEDY